MCVSVVPHVLSSLNRVQVHRLAASLVWVFYLELPLALRLSLNAGQIKICVMEICGLCEDHNLFASLASHFYCLDLSKLPLPPPTPLPPHLKPFALFILSFVSFNAGKEYVGIAKLHSAVESEKEVAKVGLQTGRG